MRLEQNPNSKIKFHEPAWPLLIHVKDKYAEWYHLIKKPQDAYKVSLKLLTQRFKEGYWYHEPEVANTFEEFFQNQYGISLTESYILEKLKPNALGYSDPKVILPNTKRYYNSLLEEKDEYIRIKNAVENKDGKAAYFILLKRSPLQYEHFEILEFED